MSSPRLHLIGNSHLDPVWLWDWREGLTEGISTCQSILGLMEEFPELKYIRGETAIYRHVERFAPEVFRALRDRIDEGRWEVVGGTYLQPDTNLPATEVLTRHFTTGLRYCRFVLGARPKVAWAADAFGHSAGFPQILAAAGMKYFAFSRPSPRDLALPGAAFWWEAASGQKILCWRLPVEWYGNERGDIRRRLDASLAYAREHHLSDIAVFYGLGNHGGGPCRRHLLDIRSWQETTPEAELLHSTLEGFFDTLAASGKVFPVFRGELNFTLRGCYSSASRFKANYRRTEAQLLATERTATAAALLLPARSPRVETLSEEWEALLFNTFHDILPGTSIERAMDQQTDWLGGAMHRARAAELRALHQISASIDTRPPIPAADMPAAVPVLLWNAHPHVFFGQVEIEACLDHRPIFPYDKRPQAVPLQLIDAEGTPIPFQVVENEHNFLPSLPWRARVVAPVTIPPMGWRLLHFSWNEEPRLAPPPTKPAESDGAGGIKNEFYSVRAVPGSTQLDVWHRGRKLWGAHGVQIVGYDDPWGSWGGHEGEPEANEVCADPRPWTIARCEVVESGPLRAALWVEFSAGASRLSLTLQLAAGVEEIAARGRVFWAEPGRRLKLVLPVGGSARFDVPGGVVRRTACGEVPGGRWVEIGETAEDGCVLATDAFYNYDLSEDAFRVTLVRSTRYAWSDPKHDQDRPWHPYQDLGEHRFRLSLAPVGTDGTRLADALDSAPVVWATPAHKGRLASTGSIGRLLGRWRLLALKPAEDDGGIIILRAQNLADVATAGSFCCLGTEIKLGKLLPWEIGTWRLDVSDPKNVIRLDSAESPWTEDKNTAAAFDSPRAVLSSLG